MDFLETLKVSSIKDVLDKVSSRVNCHKCKKSESIYCPKCIEPLTVIPPQVELPKKVQFY